MGDPGWVLTPQDSLVLPPYGIACPARVAWCPTYRKRKEEMKDKRLPVKEVTPENVKLHSSLPLTPVGQVLIMTASCTCGLEVGKDRMRKEG